MTIGINGFEAVIPRFGYEDDGTPKRVGSSEVCFQLLTEFEKIDQQNNYIVYLPCEPTSDMPAESGRFRYKIIKDSKLWTITGLTRELIKKPRLDVFFSLTHYGPLYTPCPEVLCVLDVSYKHFPELFTKRDLIQLALWGKYSLKHATKIITISQSSKNDIIEEYRVPESKVDVVHLGIKQTTGVKMTKKELADKFGFNSSYILFVGTLQPRKNIARLIEAFSKLDTDSKLVVVGRPGWHYDEIISAPEKYGVSEKVVFLKEVSDDELPSLYEHAEVFVLPSLYEGFGLPVLEAMRYGCPVVTSNISSLPEAGGDAALYFDPNNVDDIAKKIDKVLSDKTLREKMVKDGYEQIKKFSWEKTAKQVIKVLESAAQ